jgi:hypothetical protein
MDSPRWVVSLSSGAQNPWGSLQHRHRRFNPMSHSEHGKRILDLSKVLIQLSTDWHWALWLKFFLDLIQFGNSKWVWLEVFVRIYMSSTKMISHSPGGKDRTQLCGFVWELFSRYPCNLSSPKLEDSKDHIGIMCVYSLWSSQEWLD